MGGKRGKQEMRGAKTRRKTKEGEARRKESEQCLFPAALFHSGTPPVARSTAEAASQSPLLVCPVTLHHWGQRALRLPINEPASASVPLPPPQTPTIQWETKMKQKEKGIVSAAA